MGYVAPLFGAKIGRFLAHWSDTDLLPLLLETDCFQERPMSAVSPNNFVHEAAHVIPGVIIAHGNGRII